MGMKNNLDETMETSKKLSDKNKIEKAMANARASLAIEDMLVKEKETNLVRQSL